MESTMDTYIDFIKNRFTELRNQTFRGFLGGMQNAVILVGETLVFRFPLSPDSDSYRTEKRLLPKLRERLQMPIPNILYVSEEGEEQSYLCYPIIEGKPLTNDIFMGLNDEAKERLARDIAGFLTELHTFREDELLVGCPDELRSAWLCLWDTMLEETEQIVCPHVGEVERQWIRRIRDEFLRTEEKDQRFAPCLIHGDLKQENIIFDDTADRIGGIIDFGQLKMGDPAYDFHYLYLNFGEDFIRRVYLEYGGSKDLGFFQRIEIYAYVISFTLLTHAVKIGNDQLWEDGMEWLSAIARYQTEVSPGGIGKG